MWFKMSIRKAYRKRLFLWDRCSTGLPRWGRVKTNLDSRLITYLLICFLWNCENCVNNIFFVERLFRQLWSKIEFICGCHSGVGLQDAYETTPNLVFILFFQGHWFIIRSLIGYQARNSWELLDLDVQEATPLC